MIRVLVKEKGIPIYEYKNKIKEVVCQLGSLSKEESLTKEVIDYWYDNSN